MKEDEMKNIVDNNTDKEIIHELERLNMDDTFRFEYDAELRQKQLVNSVRAEGFDEGLEQGLEQGFEQGSYRKTKTIVLKLNSMDYKFDDIANIVGISVKEVEDIINSEK